MRLDQNLEQIISETPRENIRALASAISAVVPYDLFTILTVDWTENLVRRAYSTDEHNYPSGGVKRLMNTPWANQVLHNGEAFFASTPNEMACAFADHAVLSALDLHNALNVPIRQTEKTCFSLNLLRRDREFTPNEGYEVLRVFGKWSSRQLSNQ